MTAYGGPLKFRRYGRQGSRTYRVIAPWDELGTVSQGDEGWYAQPPNPAWDVEGPFPTRREAAAALPGGY